MVAMGCLHAGDNSMRLCQGERCVTEGTVHNSIVRDTKGSTTRAEFAPWYRCSGQRTLIGGRATL